MQATSIKFFMQRNFIQNCALFAELQPLYLIYVPLFRAPLYHPLLFYFLSAVLFSIQITRWNNFTKSRAVRADLAVWHSRDFSQLDSKMSLSFHVSFRNVRGIVPAAAAQGKNRVIVDSRCPRTDIPYVQLTLVRYTLLNANGNSNSVRDLIYLIYIKLSSVIYL